MAFKALHITSCLILFIWVFFFYWNKSVFFSSILMKSFPSKEVCKSAPECIFYSFFLTEGFQSWFIFLSIKLSSGEQTGGPFTSCFTLASSPTTPSCMWVRQYSWSSEQRCQLNLHPPQIPSSSSPAPSLLPAPSGHILFRQSELKEDGAVPWRSSEVRSSFPRSGVREEVGE